MTEFCSTILSGLPVMVKANHGGDILNIFWRKRKKIGRGSFITTGKPIPHSIWSRISPKEWDRLREEAQIEALSKEWYDKELSHGQ